MSPEQAVARIMNMLPGLSLEEKRREMLMIVRQVETQAFSDGVYYGLNNPAAKSPGARRTR